MQNKIDFDLLKTFNENQIIEGIKNYYQNAISLFETAEELAKNKKFGIATALTIISVEEVMKANAVFLVYIGETNAVNVNYVLKGNNLHRSRLKLASMYNIILEKININHLTKIISDKLLSFEPNKDQKFDTKEKLMNFIDLIKEHISPVIDSQLLVVPENIDDTINKQIDENTKWFFQAQEIKEQGVYADFINNKWHSPSNMTKIEYDNAYENAYSVFDNVGHIIEEIINSDPLKREILRKLIIAFKNKIENKS